MHRHTEHTSKFLTDPPHPRKKVAQSSTFLTLKLYRLKSWLSSSQSAPIISSTQSHDYQTLSCLSSCLTVMSARLPAWLTLCLLSSLCRFCTAFVKALKTVKLTKAHRQRQRMWSSLSPIVMSRSDWLAGRQATVAMKMHSFILHQPSSFVQRQTITANEGVTHTHKHTHSQAQQLTKIVVTNEWTHRQTHMYTLNPWAFTAACLSWAPTTLPWNQPRQQQQQQQSCKQWFSAFGSLFTTSATHTLTHTRCVYHVLSWHRKLTRKLHQKRMMKWNEKRRNQTAVFALLGTCHTADSHPEAKSSAYFFFLFIEVYWHWEKLAAAFLLFLPRFCCRI